MLTVLLIVFILAVLINVPIGICLGLSSLAALIYSGDVPLIIMAQRMITGLDVSTLLAIPLFIFAGKVMEVGGISRRLVNLAYEAVGFLPGSLGMVTVLGCMFFAALSGSAPATVIAIGSILAPMMIEDGYPPNFTVALAAAAGTIGVIIPPSIPFVNYAVLSGTSIGDMFIAGIIPGILMGGVLLIYCYVMAKKHGWGREIKKFNFHDFFQALKKSILALLMPVIVLGGIYGGIFTPTEAAAVSCVYGVVVSALVYKEIEIKSLPRISYEGGLTTAMIMLIVATATTFSWILTTEQVPMKLASAIMSVTENPFLILMLINIILIINGCFMELTASTFIFVPILLPLIKTAGINLLQFGVMAVMNMTLGLLTPPLGVNLFIAKGIDKRTDFNGIVKAVLPLFGLLILCLLAVTYIPALSTGLVSLLK